MESRFGQSFHSMWDGKLYNPVVLVRLPDGTTTWTQGQNISLEPEDVIGYVATIEAKSEEEVENEMKKTYKNQDASVFYIDRDDHTVHKMFGLSDHGLSFYHDCENGKCLTDCGDVWAAVLDDWRTDTYSFIAFTKVPEMNNIVACVDVGQPRHWDDMGGDTGLTAALEAYTKYIAEHKAA